VKSALNGSKFERPDELLQGIHDFLNEVQGSELMMVFYHWIERVRWVIEHDGDYYQDKQYGGEIILPNLTSEAGAKTYGPPCIDHFARIESTIQDIAWNLGIIE
jgi:hypothetical protein